MRFFSAVGEDARADAIRRRLEVSGVKPCLSPERGANTASYLALMDGDNDLHAAVADMDVLERIPCPPEECLSRAR